MKTPTFPTYHGPPLPEVLNPLNPRHYLILLGWVYFQPSRLKHYLHRADPDLYRETGRAIFRTVRLPAYRNLYLMSLVLVVVLASGLAWTASAVQGTPVDWTGVAGGVAGGVGASRLLFHCFEWPLVRLRRRPEPDPFSQLARHPALWDELAVWPLPGLDRLLQTCLEKELLHGGGGRLKSRPIPFKAGRPNAPCPTI